MNQIQKTFRKNDIGNYYQEGVWELLRKDEKVVLERLSEHNIEPIAEHIFLAEDSHREALSNLERLGLVTSSDRQIRLTSTLFHAWVQRRLGT